MRQERFDTPGQVELVVDNKLGDVRLRSHPGATTEVELRGHGAQGDEIVERARVEHQTSGANDRVVVEVPHQSGWLWRGGSSVAVTVRLPEGALADLETVSGTVSAEGRLGAATVRTTSGDISLATVDGDLVSRTTSGDITVGPVTGDADISTTSGFVRCGAVGRGVQVKTASGDVVVGSAGLRFIADTTSGDVTVDELADGCEVKTTSGDLRVRRLVAGKAELKTISGDVIVGIARGTAVMIDAESLSGSLSSEIELYPDEPGPGAADESEGPRAELRARSISGDVRIQRAPA